MLAEIFAGLDDIADIQESFMFDSDMAKLDKVKLNEVMADLEPRTVYLMFMPSYYEKWEYLARTIPGHCSLSIHSASRTTSRLQRLSSAK